MRFLGGWFEEYWGKRRECVSKFKSARPFRTLIKQGKEEGQTSMPNKRVCDYLEDALEGRVEGSFGDRVQGGGDFVEEEDVRVT